MKPAVIFVRSFSLTLSLLRGVKWILLWQVKVAMPIITTAAGIIKRTKIEIDLIIKVFLFNYIDKQISGISEICKYYYL